ncbi:TetR family transcriptional regulator [Jatrophihabitans sp. GAS493]|uniref:TetR/AcrR family transcriptional regulator n=1 Tax=Jatrophihabitans sp. GAS493 TaxID=1907575 RepID=UPI000BB7B914|nr:TetR/AcrR family transcriptional regulator [Jatrophihabitans sp. GAS493]SOD74138.1 TetR family transcriptional regulator [Jatrophihabitans sp. GAS493]
MSPGGDPLFDTLFRSTAPDSEPAQTVVEGADPNAVVDEAVARPPQPIDSAVPLRAVGTRSRAGNSMSRTRAALLDGARSAVLANGTRVSMAQIAAASGVAKATLYNHFRTRDAVLGALVADEVRRLVEQAQAIPLGEALRGCASAIGSNSLRAALAEAEPEALVALATIPPVGTVEQASSDSADVAANPLWERARAAIDAALTADRPAGAPTPGPQRREMILRWLASFLLSPGDEAQIAFDVTALLGSAASNPVDSGSSSPGDPHPSGAPG